MIELSIPQAGEETKASKDIVFSILRQQQPLSAIQIVNISRRQYNVGLTYQAITKAINALVEQQVLIKEERLYRINKTWLMQLKSTVDELLMNYDTGKQKTSFSTDFTKDKYASYTLANLFDLDNFWNDILIHLASNLQPSEHRSFVGHVHYSWWLFINLGQETRLFESFIKKKINCYNLSICKTPLNRWAQKSYSDLGLKFKVGTEKPEIKEMVDVNVVGDSVIQVHYPKKIVKLLVQFYEKYDKIEEISSRELTKIVHTQCEIKFTVFQNSEIAKSLREQYLKEMSNLK